MKELLTEVLPNLTKSLLVIAITTFVVLHVSPPILPEFHFDTDWGTIYIVPAVCALFLGSFLNRFIDNIYSLGVLAAFAFLVFQFGYELHAHVARFIR